MSGLQVERRGSVTHVQLDRPERRNALSYDVIRGMCATFDELRTNPAQRVVILSGAAGTFCAGIDLKQRGAGEPWDPRLGQVQDVYALQQEVAHLVQMMRRIPQPVVAVVTGVAAGGGLSLACAADIRIAEPEARFDAAFVRLGASGGDMGTSFFLPRLVGADRAAEILYTGRAVDADEAVEIGLVSRLVPAGEGLSAAFELANRIVAVAPMSTRMTKSLLNLSLDGASLEQMLELENRTQVVLTQTEDFAEGVRAFQERRSPAFSDM